MINDLDGGLFRPLLRLFADGRGDHRQHPQRFPRPFHHEAGTNAWTVLGPDCGLVANLGEALFWQAATLYLADDQTAADGADWQDLIFLLSVVALQQALARREASHHQSGLADQLIYNVYS